ncbi:hypothetical protein K2X92_04600 [Candidatus Gracilibacteria bacterium]|nr:hypothetical protein [Candidatus Gracilibacteria bacterium]
MSISKILVYLLALVALIFEGFFGVIPFLSFISEVIITSVGILLLVSIFRRSVFLTWKETLKKYILTIFATFGFFTSIFLVFIGYQNAVPGVVSDIHLSYSGQSIVFVEMSHIATDRFFAEKKETITKLAQDGYVILVEGVKPGTKENQEIFDRTIGFEFTPTLYKEVANLILLQNQNNQVLFDQINTGSLVSVDLSVDDIVTFMGTGNMVGTGELVSIEGELRTIMGTINDRERSFVSWIARGLLNWSLKQSADIDTLITTGPQSKLFSAIIDRRNDKIIEYIESNPKQKIAIVYGALHFNGVYEALQKKNAWNVVLTKSTAPYIK